MNLESFLTLRHLQESPAEVIRTLEGADANALYRAVLAVQNELHIGAVLRYLDGRPEGRTARTVLDLGCGPGDLIAHLCRHAPDKTYTGVDIDPDFIAVAGGQTRGSSQCRFLQADLYEFAQGRYDLIILRAVLQHLKDPGRLLAHLPGLLSATGVVLFLDTTRENFVDADPPIATFNAFYDLLGEAQRDHTGSRDCMAELEGRLPGSGFRPLESRELPVPVSGEEDRRKVVQYLLLACAIASRMMALPVDLHALAADLLRWHKTPDSRLTLRSKLLLVGCAGPKAADAHAEIPGT